jgi:hypothetical protein
MGHCGEFGDLLWAAAEKLVMRWGDFSGFDYALWASV